MKKKKLFSKIVLLSLLTALLFQTFHSYEHLLASMTVEICEHNASPSKKQITHAHTSSVEQCGVCALSISSFLVYDLPEISLVNTLFQPLKIALKNTNCTSFFKGSLFSLRGPPSLS